MNKISTFLMLNNEALQRLLNAPDRQKAACVMQAMRRMQKIDIAGLQWAYEGA